MADFATMIASVSANLIDPSNTAISEQTVKNYLNKSLEYWKYRRFWFNEVNDTASLVSQDPDFPVPADFLVPVVKDGGFVIEYGGVRYPVVKIDTLVYDSLYLANGYGLPRWYARNGNAGYQCWPIPNTDYTLRRHYLRNYDPFSDDTDENDFSEYASDLLELWASYWITSRLRQDREQAAEFKSQAMDVWNQLNVMNNKTNSAGKLTLYSNLLNGVY